MPITTFVNTIEVKNKSPQLVIFRIKSVDSSAIFSAAGGNINLQPATVVEAEESRFDLKQLETLKNNNLISTTRFNRRITRDSSESTSSGSGS